MKKSSSFSQTFWLVFPLAPLLTLAFITAEQLVWSRHTNLLWPDIVVPKWNKRKRDNNTNKLERCGNKNCSMCPTNVGFSFFFSSYYSHVFVILKRKCGKSYLLARLKRRSEKSFHFGYAYLFEVEKCGK